MKGEEGRPGFGTESPHGTFWDMPALLVAEPREPTQWAALPSAQRDSFRGLGAAHPAQIPRSSALLGRSYPFCTSEDLFQASQALMESEQMTECSSLESSEGPEGMLRVGSPPEHLRQWLLGECPSVSQR